MRERDRERETERGRDRQTGRDRESRKTDIHIDTEEEETRGKKGGQRETGKWVKSLQHSLQKISPV